MAQPLSMLVQNGVKLWHLVNLTSRVHRQPRYRSLATCKARGSQRRGT